MARYVDAHNTLANAIRNVTFLPNYGVMFQVDSMSQLISKNLIENNFLSHFSKENFSGYPKGDYIGYRQHTGLLDPNEIALHLNYQWLSDEKISLSKNLRSAIVSRILEIFMNAYGHGVVNNKLQGVGVTSCGQYYRKEKKLRLTVVDFGCGIFSYILSVLVELPVSSAHCMALISLTSLFR